MYTTFIGYTCIRFFFSYSPEFDTFTSGLAQILDLAAASSCCSLSRAFFKAGLIISPGATLYGVQTDLLLTVSYHFMDAGPILYPASLRVPPRSELKAKNSMN